MKRTALVSLLLPALALAGGIACTNSGLGSGQRDTRCDDGDPAICAMVEPDCSGDTIAAVQDGCWICVLPSTCEPPVATGDPCTTDLDCPSSQWCNPCGAASCPMCTDCVAVCQDHGCASEGEPLCNMLRPECAEGSTAVVRDSCWVCVDRTTCQPARDPSCDDGTEPLCEMVPPECDPSEILAYQNQCYVCVNPATCAPWGEPACQSDADCGPEDRCDPCGSSSCPECDNCVAACLPHGCPTETELQCFGLRPDCDPGWVAILVNGCWECVDMNACAD